MKTDSCVEDITSLREKKKWERKIKKKKKNAVHTQYFQDIVKQQIGTLLIAQLCGQNINQSSHFSLTKIKYVSHIQENSFNICDAHTAT